MLENAKIKSLVLMTLSFTMCLSINVFASQVFVEEVRGISVPESDALVIKELIKSSLVEEMGHTVVDSMDKSDFSISGRLMKLGDSITLTLIKSNGTSEVFRTSLKAKQMSDMDVVVKRLVRAISEENSAEDNAGVKDVTQEEEQNSRRRKEVLSQFTFALGPATTDHMKVEGNAILWNIGYNFELDYKWDMHLDVDWLSTLKHSENDAYYYGVNFGINYYFTTKNMSPFMDAHFGYGTASASTGCSSSSLICSSKDRATGWMIGTGIGFRFFRTSKSNFSFMLRGSMLTEKTNLSEERPLVGSLMIVGYFH